MSLAEQGLVGAEGGGWYAIVTPAGVPKAIRDKLTAAIMEVTRSPAVTDKLVATGWNVAAAGQEELAALMRSELARYGKIVEQKKITVGK